MGVCVISKGTYKLHFTHSSFPNDLTHFFCPKEVLFYEYMLLWLLIDQSKAAIAYLHGLEKYYWTWISTLKKKKTLIKIYVMKIV